MPYSILHPMLGTTSATMPRCSQGTSFVSAQSYTSALSSVLCQPPAHEAHVGAHCLDILQAIAVLGKHGLPLAQCAPAAARAHRQDLDGEQACAEPAVSIGRAGTLIECLANCLKGFYVCKNAQRSRVCHQYWMWLEKKGLRERDAVRTSPGATPSLHTLWSLSPASGTKVCIRTILISVEITTTQGTPSYC